MWIRPLGWAVRLNLVVAAAYWATGWLGLQLPYYGEDVTLVWVPTAIALAAVVLGGPALIPGIFLGSFVLNLCVEPNFPGPSALVAASNTLAPSLAGLALVHLFSFRPELDRARDAFVFLTVGVLATGMVTATFGALVLCAFGRAPWADYPVVWLTWIGGEAVGLLIVAPVLFSWSSVPDPGVTKPAGPVEKLAMAVAIAVFCAAVLAYGERFVSLPYAFCLLFVWIVFRAGMRAALLAAAVVALALVIATALGVGPFILQPPRAGMLSLWMTLAAGGSGCLVTAVVVAERDRALQHQRRLIAELDHRVKNTLATVVALAERSHDRAVDVDDFHARFIGRVRAIACTHEGLARSNWKPMKVADVVAMTLAPFAGTGADHLHATGDGTTLAPSQVTPLTMVLHELATNAAKYGAWSQNGGKVAVTWAQAGDRSLRIDWRENDGPRLSGMPIPGYGLRLIEGIVDHQLGGRTELAFREEGLRCTIHLPSV